MGQGAFSLPNAMFLSGCSAPGNEPRPAHRKVSVGEGTGLSEEVFKLASVSEQ